MSVLAMVALMLAVASAVVTCRLAIRERRRTEARMAALTAALDEAAPTPVSRTAETPELFRLAPAALEPRPLPLALGFGAVAVAGVLLLGISLATEAVSETDGPASLELLSMSHERAETALAVTGRVRWTGMVEPDRLEAEVLAFAADGRQVGSDRAPLVFGTGADASFRITIAEAPDAVRYRVRFRSGADAVRHLDRR